MRKKNIPYCFISLVFFLLYRWGSFLKIPFGDCVGQVLDAEKGDFVLKTYSTTHFLYVNLLVLLKNIFPFIDSIELCRYFVILSAIFVLNILYKTIYTLTKQKFSALIGAFCLGLSFSFWRSAEIVEVYTFNMVFVSLYILLTVQSFLHSPKYTLYAGIVLGLSFWCHIQNILLIPSYIFVLWNLYPKQYRKIGIYSGVVAISFLTLYIEPFYNKEPIVKVLSSTNSSWVGGSFKKSIGQYAKDVIKSIGYLLYNFWYFIAFAALGLKYMYTKSRALFYFFCIFSIPVYGFATIYAVSDNYVFFLNSYLIIAILIGIEISYVLTNSNRIKKYWIILGVTLIPFLYSASKYILFNTQKGHKFHLVKL